MSTLITARTVFTAFAALLFASAAGCAPQHYADQAPSAPATYYPLAVGDRWTYRYSPDPKNRQYNVDVTEARSIGGVQTYAVAIHQSYSYLAVLPSGVYQFAQGLPQNPTSAVVFQPAQRIYKLPFVVGDEWNTPVLLEASNPKSQIVRLYGRVDDIQDVTVPAGTFKNCVRVLIDDPRDTPANVSQIWFAANVGIVQTQTSIDRPGNTPKVYNTELVSYRLK